MSRVVSIAVAIMIAACLAGCGDDAESTVSGILAKKKELVGVLKGVTDKRSADAAKPKIEAIFDDVKKLGSGMGEGSDGEGMAKALTKHRGEVDQVQKEFQAELARIDKIPGARDAMAESMVGFAGMWLSGGGTKP
jgi:thiamine biosynthesis lipoprotein ApbE